MLLLENNPLLDSDSNSTSCWESVYHSFTAYSSRTAQRVLVLIKFVCFKSHDSVNVKGCTNNKLNGKILKQKSSK